VTHVALDWPLLAALAGAAVVGSLVGTRLARHASPDVLRQAFGWLVLAMGAFVLTAQAPPGVARATTALASLAGIALAVALTRRRRQLASHHP
jgi:hypothetical protein